jgi:hypothetical protein
MCYFTAIFRPRRALLVYEDHSLRFPCIVLTDGLDLGRIRQREQKWKWQKSFDIQPQAQRHQRQAPQQHRFPSQQHAQEQRAQKPELAGADTRQRDSRVNFLLK